MPPIMKISKEMIIEAAYEIIDKQGMEFLNSRNIAKMLNCSTQPVFSRFPNMDVLKKEVFSYACSKLEKEIKDASTEGDYFKNAYLLLTKMASEHSRIFKLIYLSDYESTDSFMETRLSYTTNKLIREEFVSKYGLSQSKAENIFERLSLLVHGIATVLATTSMDYSQSQIENMVDKTLEDMLMGAKMSK